MLIRICVFLWLCLCLCAAVEAAGDVPVHVPSTVTAVRAQDLIERASRALQARFAGARISELEMRGDEIARLDDFSARTQDTDS